MKDKKNRIPNAKIGVLVAFDVDTLTWMDEIVLKGGVHSRTRFIISTMRALRKKPSLIKEVVKMSQKEER